MALIHTLLFVAFVVGLVRPKFVLFGIKEPSRIKVIVYYLGISVLLILADAANDSVVPNSERVAYKANALIASGEYQKAIELLNSVDSTSAFFDRGRELSDSLEIVLSENLKKAQEAKELAAIQKAAAEKQAQLDRLTSDIVDLRAAEAQNYGYYTVDQMIARVEVFRRMAKTVYNATSSSDPEVLEMAKNLELMLGKHQKKVFPIMRKSYSKIADSKLWESDVDVYTSGNLNSNIVFVGGVFAANKNKKEFNDQVLSILRDLRFKKAVYKWYEYDDSPEAFHISDYSDSELLEY